MWHGIDGAHGINWIHVGVVCTEPKRGHGGHGGHVIVQHAVSANGRQVVPHAGRQVAPHADLLHRMARAGSH